MPLRHALAIALFALASTAAASQSLLREDFEGPETSFQEARGDAAYKVDFHRRVRQAAHSGQGSERITVSGNNGTYVYFVHAIGAARVIGELTPSVWIKADRPGVQILARVALPRTIDPRSNKPLAVLVPGEGYTQADGWQQLRVTNIPRLVDRQVRLQQSQFGREIDSREAYVDQLVLNVYGGPGVTNVWVDDLEVAGAVARLADTASTISDTKTHAPDPAVKELPLVWSEGQGVPLVALQQTLLMVGGQPFFPRIIEHRGEPLARLRELGFNAVRLARAPTSDVLREAARTGMWLVAPPPSQQELGSQSTPGIPNTFDPVLAWDLGGGLAHRDLEATRQWAKLVVGADPRRRPIVCEAESDLRRFTRPPVNLFMSRRNPLGTSLSLADYGNWLRERAQLVLPGTPLWATIQTEPAPGLSEQIAMLSSSSADGTSLDEWRIRMLLRTALAAGARGVCFESRTRLDAQDAATQPRAAMLELLNLELEVIDRWPASGTFSANADSNDPAHITGAVIETDRSRLLLPICATAHCQFVPANPSVKPLGLRVAGVPEGDDAYELTPAGLHRLPSNRVAGGTQVTLKDLARDSLVVYTGDKLVYSALDKRVAKSTAQSAKLAHFLAADQLARTQAGEGQLAAVGRALPATAPLRTIAEMALKQCESALERQDYKSAYDQARQVLQATREIERMHWDQAMTSKDWPLANPLAVQFATLADYYRLTNELATAARGPNLLAAGDFEDLNWMWHTGWRYNKFEAPADEQRQPPLVTTAVELSRESAHGGASGLRLRVQPTNPDKKLSVVETPPMWVTSPNVQLQQGQLVQIQGWLRIVQPITASVDGLLIIDSLAGDALAQRVTAAPQWRQFTLYRAVPRSGPMSLTFALAGLGEVELDDIAIHVVQRGVASPPQQAVRLPSTHANQRR